MSLKKNNLFLAVIIHDRHVNPGVATKIGPLKFQSWNNKIITKKKHHLPTF